MNSKHLGNQPRSVSPSSRHSGPRDFNYYQSTLVSKRSPKETPNPTNFSNKRSQAYMSKEELAESFLQNKSKAPA